MSPDLVGRFVHYIACFITITKMHFYHNQLKKNVFSSLRCSLIYSYITKTAGEKLKLPIACRCLINFAFLSIEFLIFQNLSQRRFLLLVAAAAAASAVELKH